MSDSKELPSNEDDDISRCSAAVLSGLVLQLNSRKAWKRYIKGALSDGQFCDVAYYEVHGKPFLVVAVANRGSLPELVDKWMSEIREAMELWRLEFNGVAFLYSGHLTKLQI